MNDAEKAYQYFVITVPENEEQAKAYFWARKALQPTLTPPNEALTLEQLRSYRVETDLASWHPEICDRAADYITDLLARCDRLEEARENANEACAKWETLCHMAEQERDTYKAALQNWHEEE